MLQALTLSSATLTLVRSNATLVVEKLMKFSNNRHDISEETEKFIQKSVQTLFPQLRKKQEKGNKAKGSVKKEHFTSALSEGWIRPGVLTQSTDAIAASLTRYGYVLWPKLTGDRPV